MQFAWIEGYRGRTAELFAAAVKARHALNRLSIVVWRIVIAYIGVVWRGPYADR
jgi:hypothetical protein